MSTPSIAKSRNLKTAASKKRSVKSSATARRQVTSAATRAKALPKRRTKGRASYQAGAPADTAELSRGASIEEMTQATDWQQHSVRGFLAGGEEEAWFLADHFESGRRRRPLPHRDASRSLTWPSRRSISRSCWRGFPPTIFELRGEWRRLHRAPPPMRLSRDLLMRGITYKLQGRPFGGLSKSIIRKLERPNLGSEASDAQKPLWMGGNVPLGYDVRKRKLVVSEAEASTARMIFQRCAELGSVALIAVGAEAASRLPGLIFDSDGAYHSQSLRASHRPAHSGGRHRRAGARPSARPLRVWCGSQ